MGQLNDKLLSSWLTISATFRNERFMDNLSFNEAFICSIIYRQAKENQCEPYVSIKEICLNTSLLKSQVNKVINDLEKKKIVERLRFGRDRRLVYVQFCEEGSKIFEQEHMRILQIVDRIIEAIGTKKTKETILLLNEIAEKTNLIMSKGEF